MTIPSSKFRRNLSESLLVSVGVKMCDVPNTINSVLQVDGFNMLDPQLLV